MRQSGSESPCRWLWLGGVYNLKRIRSGSICTKPQTLSYIESYYTVYSEMKWLADHADGEYRACTIQLLDTFKERLRRKYALCLENEKQIIQKNRELFNICNGLL